MGDKASGGTQSTQQFSNNQSGPSPVIAPKLESLLGSQWDWMGQNMSAPGYFPGGTVAPRSPQELAGREGALNWANMSLNGLQPAFGGAINSLQETINGKYLDPKLNTAFQDYLEASFRPQAEQFRDIIAPSLDAKFAGSGRTAGGAHVDTTMRGVKDLEQAQADAASKAGLGLYQGERNLQQGAAQLLPGVIGQMGNQATHWLNMINGVGAGDTAYAQRQLDDQNAKYSYDSTAQLDWYNRLAQTLLGMYPGGQTSGNSNSYGTAASGGGGGVGSFLGPALQVAGMALPFFSDARLKDVVGRVGQTDEGLPLYLYTYKGDDTPQIGPMAQHVEQVKPDAVAEHASGYKVVDYSRLVPEGGLL